MEWRKAVQDNADSKEGVLEKGKLLIEHMTVGRDWKIFTFKADEWHYEIYSKRLHLRVYAGHGSKGEPVFSAGFYGYNPLWDYTEICKSDPNEAVLAVINRMRKHVAKQAASLKELTEAL
jgi:hypothetical protein